MRLCPQCVSSTQARDSKSSAAPLLGKCWSLPDPVSKSSRTRSVSIPYLEAASVVIAPVRTGGGMRMKVLEGLAREKAVVTTTRGAEGFTRFEADLPLVVADDPEEIAMETAKLLADPRRRRDLGRRAREFAQRHHSPAAWGARLEAVYEEARRTPPLGTRSRDSAYPGSDLATDRPYLTSQQPFELSVVIASHNRRQLLRRCLESLAAQTQDPNTFEVIVADDGSTDDTVEMVGNLELPFRLRLLQLQKAGKAVAVNAAIQASSSPLCLFTDDDVIASPDLVSEHIAAHRKGDLTGVGRLVQEPPMARDWYAHAFAQGFNEHYQDLVHRPTTWADCYGANLSVRRSALIEVGGFATDLSATDDLELGFRLSQAGYPPQYIPRAKGIHDDQKRVSQMLEDARLQGAAHVRVMQMHLGAPAPNCSTGAPQRANESWRCVAC